VVDRFVSVLMTFNDPNPGCFKVTVEYLNTVHLMDKVTNRKPYPFFRMEPLSMTLSDL